MLLKAQDQDQDSLLVKRRNDNHSPGPVIRELVPSSHQRSELLAVLNDDVSISNVYGSERKNVTPDTMSVFALEAEYEKCRQ